MDFFMLESDNKEKIASNILNYRNNEFALNSDELDRIFLLMEKLMKLRDENIFLIVFQFLVGY